VTRAACSPPVALVLAAATLLGCAARSPADLDARKVGRAELEPLPPPDPGRPVEASALALAPEGAAKTLIQALPAYPDAALSDAVDCRAELLYHIETDGSATLVRLEWNPPPPAGHVAGFEASIRDAVATWRFEPAYQLRLKERADGGMTYEKRLIPKARRVAVRFRVEDGKAVVE